MDQDPYSAAVHELFERCPVDWTQAVSGRAALRLLPLAIANANAEWLQGHSLSLFRAAAVIFYAQADAVDIERSVLFRAAADAAFVARASARAAATLDPTVILTADALANATDATRADDYPAFASAAASLPIIDARLPGAPHAFRADVEWLDVRKRARGDREGSLSGALTATPLWPALDAESRAAADGGYDLADPSRPTWFADAWSVTQDKLLARDRGFALWIRWYAALLDGHKDRFSSVAGADRIVEANLLAADDVFWSQTDRIVNASIGELIQDVEFETKLADLRALAAKRGQRAVARGPSPQRSDLIRGLQAVADARLDNPMKGHNMPPDDLEWDIAELITADLSREAQTALIELAKPEPNIAKVEEKVSLIRRALRKLASLSGIAADKAAEGFGKVLGEGVGTSVRTVMIKVSHYIGALLFHWIKGS